MKIKKITGKIHLWLGFTSGAIVLFLGITGCILAFQREIEAVTMPYQKVATQQASFLSPLQIGKKVAQQFPGKSAHSVTFGKPDDAAKISYYSAKESYYYIVFADPYSGRVLQIKDMSYDFFRIVLMGHFYLFMPPAIGQPIVATATLIFVFLLISGFILWFPKNKAALKQRFSIKWKAGWRRVNYDMHNVPGFYSLLLAFTLSFTGLMWGFKWFSKSVYFTATGGKSQVEYYETFSEIKNKYKSISEANVDLLWSKMKFEYPNAETIEIHYPENDSAAIHLVANPDATTYWKADSRYFDQYTLKELSVSHPYGRYSKANAGDMLVRMNYDIHVGAIAGLPGKILAFIASLIAASLPVTGFMIWKGRRKKASRPKFNNQIGKVNQKVSFV